MDTASSRKMRPDIGRAARTGEMSDAQKSSGPARAVLIAGPTASGKSALALRLAQRLGGAIINADSLQVYRYRRILTARPTQADEQRVPHLLFGTVDAATNFSVGRYLAAASVALEAARAADCIPI